MCLSLKCLMDGKRSGFLQVVALLGNLDGLAQLALNSVDVTVNLLDRHIDWSDVGSGGGNLKWFVWMFVWMFVRCGCDEG